MTIQFWKAREWWRDLQPDPAAGRTGDRGALAQLRRCSTVAHAMQQEATIRLFRRLGASGPRDLPDVALAAAVLAHVRQDAPGNVARIVGPATLEKPETALLKPLRFRRLMEAQGHDERLTAFRRLVALAGGTLPVTDLAAALINWSEDRQRRWVYHYWGADLPADLSPTPATLPAAAPNEDATP